MKEETSLRTGIIGTFIAALCCFTPLLVIGLGVVGLSAWVSGLDYVLFPVMFASMGLTAHALYLRSGKVGPRPKLFLMLAVVAVSVLIIWLEFRFALRISVAAAAVVAAYAWYLRRGKSSNPEENIMETQS